ncbi:ATP-binding cassette domain-containing protein [Roseobacter fucihabitans]|uniref:ATP-binding cassette domain-containing protein n=1 Tax=Roseobacter fucihabitans TaxID=1537242 RepID=UPI001653181E
MATRGGDLSTGQQKQLAIVHTLIMKPKVLLLDERRRLSHQNTFANGLHKLFANFRIS